MQTTKYTITIEIGKEDHKVVAQILNNIGQTVAYAASTAIENGEAAKFDYSLSINEERITITTDSDELFDELSQAEEFTGFRD